MKLLLNTSGQMKEISYSPSENKLFKLLAPSARKIKVINSL